MDFPQACASRSHPGLWTRAWLPPGHGVIPRIARRESLAQESCESDLGADFTPSSDKASYSRSGQSSPRPREDSPICLSCATASHSHPVWVCVPRTLGPTTRTLRVTPKIGQVASDQRKHGICPGQGAVKDLEVIF